LQSDEDVSNCRAGLILSAAAAFAAGADLAGRSPANTASFALFEPLVTMSLDDRMRLDRGEVVVRVLPARDGEVAVFAASRLDAPPEALVRWTNAIEALKRGPYVLAIRRFSNPPVLSDLDGLTLDEADLEGIRQCQAGDCSVKLSAYEIEALKNVAGSGADWKSDIQREFRRLLLSRVVKYSAEGLGGLPPYADSSDGTVPRDEFAGILNRSPHLRNNLPAVADGLSNYPQAAIPDGESFLYWSKERYDRGKSVVAVTQVHIVRPGSPLLPSVVVLGQEIFASHYRDGSLSTSLVLDEGQSRYLVYLNRSRLDRLGGMLGGVKRTLLERRLAPGVRTAIETVRERIESGDPSSQG